MFLTKKLLDKFRPGWKERKKRQKSLWHLPKILIFFILFGIIWYALFIAMWNIHLNLYPQHEGHINEFWGEGISLKSFISSFLLLIPLFLPAMGISLIIVNIIFWFILPARKAFNKEASGDVQMTFYGATLGLIKVFLKYLAPIGFVLSILGAITLSSLK